MEATDILGKNVEKLPHNLLAGKTKKERRDHSPMTSQVVWCVYYYL